MIPLWKSPIKLPVELPVELAVEPASASARLDPLQLFDPLQRAAQASEDHSWIFIQPPE